MELNKIYHGKMEDVLKDFPDNYFDSIVTDPPYGLSFMGKHWDYDVPTIEQWKEAIRVLKPGGFLLSFGGTRTYHRMVVNIEDAGFEIRDQIQWLYGSGFPKSLDIGKAIDKLQGNEREDLGVSPAQRLNKPDSDIYEAGIRGKECRITKGNSEYEGWGTALKPANEPICVARKPVEGTVANNVLKYGTGGINIDACRIGETTKLNGRSKESDENNGIFTGYGSQEKGEKDYGRFPANVILDDFMGAELDKQTGVLKSGHMDSVSKGINYGIYGKFEGKPVYAEGDEGGASRFFYCPKPDNFERNKGLKNFEKGEPPASARSKPAEGRENALGRPRANHHPTVKPIDLMRYLVKLVTKKGGICLDPFCGSGTTLIGAKMELMNYVGIDMDATHIPLSEARVAAWNPDKYKEQTLF